ncbi:MAG TPA: hypothetical protein VLJ58_09845, partial [Ramlibacter sp.]|nr:hypothetical protein [Ramlibacter sp.]
MSCKHFARRIGRKLSALAAAIVVGALGPASGAGARDYPTIEGTWINDVKIVTCPPAPHAVIASFQSMTTYMRGGILIEGGAPATPPPGVSRSAGHGIWERVEGRAPHHARFDRSGRLLPAAGGEIRALIRGHSFDAQGRLVRVIEVLTQPTLFRGDNPGTPDIAEPYYLSGDGTNRITNYDPA